MDANTKQIENKIKWMELEQLLEVMEKYMMEDLNMIKSMEKDAFTGQMEGNEYKILNKVDRMELELIILMMD